MYLNCATAYNGYLAVLYKLSMLIIWILLKQKLYLYQHKEYRVTLQCNVKEIVFTKITKYTNIRFFINKILESQAWHSQNAHKTSFELHFAFISYCIFNQN